MEVVECDAKDNNLGDDGCKEEPSVENKQEET